MIYDDGGGGGTKKMFFFLLFVCYAAIRAAERRSIHRNVGLIIKYTYQYSAGLGGDLAIEGRDSLIGALSPRFKHTSAYFSLDYLIEYLLP